MIHWTYNALRPCAVVIAQFFWGEASWGATVTMRKLRIARSAVSVFSLGAVVIVVWAVVSYTYSVEAAKASYQDNYSYYEGKILEERIAETQRRLQGQEADIKRILIEMNTGTLLAVKMQSQIDQMQDLLSAGVKVLGAVVLMVAGNLINSLLQIRVRKEAAKIGGRRGEDKQ